MRGDNLKMELKMELKISGPAGRPAGRAEVPPYPMAGKFFHPPHPPAQVRPRIDLINPDCHLLGKKRNSFCFPRAHAGNAVPLPKTEFFSGIVL